MSRDKKIQKVIDNRKTLDGELSAEDQNFCGLVAKGYTATAAYRKAHPEKENLSFSYIRRLASELLSRPEIKLEVQTKIETAAKLARLAEDRLEQILVEDDSQTKGNKVADVAMFMYEQVNGKATQRMEVKSTSVNLNLDLTSITSVD